jgi:branched-subunit amino acid aminotransferase/4-amino-4-deoxychorismate lyase
MTIWVDGQLLAGSDVPRSSGIAPFETMGAKGSLVPLWSLHIERLLSTAARLGLSFQETPELLAGASEVLRTNGHADGVLRLALVPRSGESKDVHVVIASRQRSPIKVVKLLPTIVERPDDAPPGDIKAEPRSYYDAIRQQAQDGDADDGIVVGLDGQLLETALGNLWLRIGEIWATPPLDGRVLPGVARAILIKRAKAVGLIIEERPCSLSDLHQATAVAQSNAVYGPRPASLVGERAAVEIVDTELGLLWREATSR